MEKETAHSLSKMQASLQLPIDLLGRLPAHTTALIDELNSLASTFGQGVQDAAKRFKRPGAVNARFTQLTDELTRLNVPLLWTGDTVNLDELEFARFEVAKRTGPLVMTAAEREKSGWGLASFKIQPGTNVYVDSGGESHKQIKFVFKVDSGVDPKRFALVNWKKGFFKDGNGDFFTLKTGEELNFPTWQVDSKDNDAVFGSGSSGRWTYFQEAVNAFSTNDDPGFAQSDETGAVYAMKFKMGIYVMDDIPEKMTDHVIKTKAIKVINWKYSVKVSGRGAFSHPVI